MTAEPGGTADRDEAAGTPRPPTPADRDSSPPAPKPAPKSPAPGTPASKSPASKPPAPKSPRKSVTPESPAPRRRGRPAASDSGPDGRQRIVVAARTEFAERGYDKVSVRGIAKAAGVDPALVHHYFGGKEDVFEAAVESAFAPALGAPDAVGEGPVEEVGERLTRFLLGVWENPATREPLLAVVRSAFSHEAAAAVLRRLIAVQLLRRVAGRLDRPDAELRAELAAAQLVGIAMLRYVIGVEPLASADPEQIVARVAPVVQHHLAGE